MADEVSLAITEYEDSTVIHALRVPDDGFSYLDPELVEEVANVIRQYPNSDAPAWLAPVAAILAVERRLVASSTSGVDDER